MGIAKKLGLDRSGTPEELKRDTLPKRPLPERPSQADYLYLVCRNDRWPYCDYASVWNETYKTKEEAENKAGANDTILTCMVVQVDRRKTVHYTESVKRADEP